MIHVTDCCSWEFSDFNNPFPWHSFLNNSFHRWISSNKACSFWPIMCNIVSFYFRQCLKICQEKYIFYCWHFLWCHFCLQDKFGVLNSEYQLIVLLKKVLIVLKILIILILIVLLSWCFLFSSNSIVLRV